MWSDWQAQARKHIAKFMADVPDTATWQERQKILRANAGQFHGGTSWGKKVWSKHCKAYLAMHGKPMTAFEAERKTPLFAADITFPFRNSSEDKSHG